VSITFERKVGRLVEIRTVGAQDAKQYARVIALANELGPDAKVVVLVDVRKADLLSKDAGEKLGLLVRTSAQRVMRAVVVRATGVFREMSSERIARESGSTDQQFVTTNEEALAALAPVLNAAELARAKQFLEGV
jgi:hypothetical protein